MISQMQLLDIAKTVANGHGDWSEVPRCVREAIVLSLAGPQSPMSRGIEPANHTVARYRGTWPMPREPAAATTDSEILPHTLSPSLIQDNIQTFEDAKWMRDQAVRGFAQMHNTLETLHEALSNQLSALLYTAMELDDAFLEATRQRCGLREVDEIPDNVVLDEATRGCLEQQELLMRDLVAKVHAARDASVRFAANFLSDREKVAMGADPRYLRRDHLAADAVHAAPSHVRATMRTSPQRELFASHPQSASRSASAAMQHPL